MGGQKSKRSRIVGGANYREGGLKVVKYVIRGYQMAPDQNHISENDESLPDHVGRVLGPSLLLVKLKFPHFLQDGVHFFTFGSYVWRKIFEHASS